MSQSPNSVWIWIKPDSHVSVQNLAETLGKSLRSKGFDYTIGGKPLGQENWAISIGGDGTFLSMVRRLGDQRYGVKMLGIHGSKGIGFLTVAKTPQQPSDFQSWADEIAGKIVAGAGQVRSYFGLKAVQTHAGKPIKEVWALNDIVIGRTALSRMLSLRLTYNQEVVFEKLKGDGMIFSSALGSTAYALSAGGPVIEPRIRVLQVTPVCAHPMPQRPMIFSPDSHLEVESLDQNMKAMITLDGQEGLEFGRDDKLQVNVSEEPIQIFAPEVSAKFSCGTYFQALSRLGIGGSHVSGS